MKISLFLGAGASVPFGMPTTKQFKEILSETPNENKYITQLLENPKFSDIEYVLRAIKEIRDIGEYGDSILEYVRSVENRNEGKILSELPKLEKNIHKLVYDLYNSDNVKDLKRYDWIFDFIKKYHNNIIDVFTTNYDQIIEKYVKNKKETMKLYDGFLYDATSEDHIFSSNSFTTDNTTDQTYVRLYKLHGSINWKKIPEGIKRISDDYQWSEAEDKCVIYPTLDPKDGLDSEPFESINKKFKENIKESDVLIIIGYSFRDTHVNGVFQEFLEKGKSIVVISPTASKDLESCLSLVTCIIMIKLLYQIISNMENHCR